MPAVSSSSSRRQPPVQAAGDPPAAMPLSTLAYKSRAAVPLGEAELQQLMTAAQARNRAESITGLLIYDAGRFFQWLEGPAAGLSRVWQSIRSDSRHTAIQVVGSSATPVRFFGDWSLKLAQRCAPAAGTGAASQRDALGAPGALVDQLMYRRAEAAPSLLARLAPSPAVVVTAAALPAPNPRVAELADLLLAPEADGALDLVADLATTAASIGGLYAGVLEPSARRLGDLWCSDDCTEVDVTVGMCRLRTALRPTNGRAGLAPASSIALRRHGGTVLLAPLPGEFHILGSVLDAEMLCRAGWRTHWENPATDDALQGLVAGTWFDALDLSMSLAFGHLHRLQRMARTIALARQASRNPDLRILVSGRAFFDQAELGRQIGADAASGSAMLVDALLRNCVSRSLW